VPLFSATVVALTNKQCMRAGVASALLHIFLAKVVAIERTPK
jgi:hypothetical protein